MSTSRSKNAAFGIFGISSANTLVSVRARPSISANLGNEKINSLSLRIVKRRYSGIQFAEEFDYFTEFNYLILNNVQVSNFCKSRHRIRSSNHELTEFTKKSLFEQNNEAKKRKE